VTRSPKIGEIVLLVMVLFACTARAGEYDFDIPGIKKRPYEIGGNLETRGILHRLNRHGLLYKTKYYDASESATRGEFHQILELNGRVLVGPLRARIKTHSEYVETYRHHDLDHELYEAYLTYNTSPAFTLQTGKRVFKWGKGYAWNPVGFVNRPKDPEDPERDLEGFTALGADFIRSFGPAGLQSLSFTPLILPVSNHINQELGESGDTLIAAKLYLLLYDTDLDFMVRLGPRRPEMYGIDFSRNLKENLEVHGELAYLRGYEHKALDDGGKLASETSNAFSFLFGLRYLTASDTTLIFEYYHHGEGYDSGEADRFYSFLDQSCRNYLDTKNQQQIDRAGKVRQAYLRDKNFMKDYLYLKVSQKEPFDILYLTPYITLIANLNDGSFSVSPSATYRPVTNLELTLRTIFPIGGSMTEYGEKQDRCRMELRVKYYF